MASSAVISGDLFGNSGIGRPASRVISAAETVVGVASPGLSTGRDAGCNWMPVTARRLVVTNYAMRLTLVFRGA